MGPKFLYGVIKSGDCHSFILSHTCQRQNKKHEPYRHNNIRATYYLVPFFFFHFDGYKILSFYHWWNSCILRFFYHVFLVFFVVYFVLLNLCSSMAISPVRLSPSSEWNNTYFGCGLMVIKHLQLLRPSKKIIDA